MEIGMVEKVDIDNEMQQAYLDYAMSVIVARALPDARDGLKPVHRRILYAMYDMGLRPDTPYKKSARIVGEVLGKYHPHGDMAVYEAMARMAQDFSMRNLLVDGQGNFGSVDGDAPAAMRYTEARLTSSAMRMLADIQKNTVNFSPNFDGSLDEPDVLPAALPNLLINGATGIAVGMSTSIPPHNLGEVIDALKFMLENWTKLDDLSVEDLMRFIKGPDFPTGGVIIQDHEGDGLHSSYGSGRGRVTVQARVRLEEMERGRSRLIVTELPYMTNKSSLIERIAELVREERLEGIADLRDESDRQGMRIVVELNKAADPEKVLRDLYKYTPMQSTFSIILLALVDGEPRLLSLKGALRVYLDHRLEIVRRRSQFDLEKARQRAHILEGLRIALKNLDEVIDLIRKAPDAETARERLMKRFKLTEVQAQAILDLQLRRLANLERKKIEQEYKEVLALIKDLEALLRSPAKMRALIVEELQAVKDAFDDRRRTQIIHMKEGESKLSLLTATDLTPEKTVWLSLTPAGLISRSMEAALPRLSGSDAPAWLVQASSRDILYLVTERGEAAAIPVHSLPEKEKPAEGLPFWRASPLHEGDVLAALIPLPPKGERAEDWFVLACTRQGMVKKSPLSELPGPSANTFTLMKVNEGDRLGWLRLTHGQAEILLGTAAGMLIRFAEEEVRPMGLVAAGVMGIKFQNGDEVAGMDVLPRPGDVFLVSSNGGAKRVPVKEFPKQGRYGQGVVAWKLPEKSRVVGLAVGRGAEKATLFLEKTAPKTIRLDAAPLQNRATRGQVLAEVKGDTVLRLALPWYTPRPVSGGALVGDGGDGGEQGGGDKMRRSGAGGRRQNASLGSKGEGERRQSASRAGDGGEQGKKTATRAARTGKTAAAKADSVPEPAAPSKTSGKDRAARAKSTGQVEAGGLETAAPRSARKAASTGPAKGKTTAVDARPASKTAGGAAAQKASSKAKASTSVGETTTAKGRTSSSSAKTSSAKAKEPASKAKTVSTQSKSAPGKGPARSPKTSVKSAEAASVTRASGSAGRQKTSPGGKHSASGGKTARGKATAGGAVPSGEKIITVGETIAVVKTSPTAKSKAGSSKKPAPDSASKSRASTKAKTAGEDKPASASASKPAAKKTSAAPAASKKPASGKAGSQLKLPLSTPPSKK